MKSKTHSLFAFALIGLALLSPSAFASTGTANITATVPSYCEIQQVLDVNVSFSERSSEMGSTGQLAIVCNENQQFTLSVPTTDENGILTLANANGSDSMPVEITDRAGNLWTNSYQRAGVGIGTTQWEQFNVRFNADKGTIPAVGQYTAQMQIVLEQI